MNKPPEAGLKGVQTSGLFLLVCGIFILALTLRLWGINWGLPDQLHSFSYHPDEAITLSAAISVDLPALKLNPHFYNYPSFYIYAVNLGITAASVFELVSNEGDLYITARLIAALMGVAAALLAYVAGRRMYGNLAGIFAALILAVMPLSVVHSHFATVDVPAAFWVTACLASVAYMQKSPRLRLYLLAGLLAGLAAGTKYNAGVVLLAPLTAHIVNSEGSVWRRLLDKRLLLAVLAFIGAFIFTTPGAVLWPDEFWKGFSYELWHSQHGHGLVFTNTGPGWLYTFASNFVRGLGLPMALFALTAVIYALIKRETQDWFLLVFFIVYYVMISSSEVRFSRYVMPLLPVIALLSARMIAVGLAGSRRRIWTVTVIILVAYTAIYSITLDKLFTGSEPREEALRWIMSNVDNQAGIGIPTQPWFYTPPFTPRFGLLRRPDRIASAAESEYKLAVSQEEWDQSVLNAQTQYVVISDYEKIDAERSRDPKASQFLVKLRREYHPVKSFGDEELIWNPPFTRPQELPHDMKYMHPTIWIWQRNG